MQTSVKQFVFYGRKNTTKLIAVYGKLQIFAKTIPNATMVERKGNMNL